MYVVAGAVLLVVFYYATGRKKWVRMAYLASSPVLFIFLFISYFWYMDYYREHRFSNKRTLERITGVEFPDFEVASYTRLHTTFNGDYLDILVIEFEEIPSGDFYRDLDSLVATGGHWSKQDDGSYSFGHTWGNGYPAPKGESDKEDMCLSIKIEKGEKQAEIEYGAW